MPKRGLAKSSYYKKIFHKNYDLITATYHEAGHTVCGLLHFIKVSEVEARLYKDDKIGGHILFDEISFDDNLALEFKKLIILNEIKLNYAGIIAEKILLKNISGSDISPFFLKWGSKDDIYAAASLIEKYQLSPRGRKRYAFKQKMMKEVTQELNDNWDAVIAISHLLYVKKQISYNDLKKLLCSKTKNKKFWKTQFKKIDRIFDNDSKLDENTIKSIILS